MSKKSYFTVYARILFDESSPKLQSSLVSIYKTFLKYINKTLFLFKTNDIAPKPFRGSKDITWVPSNYRSNTKERMYRIAAAMFRASMFRNRIVTHVDNPDIFFSPKDISKIERKENKVYVYLKHPFDKKKKDILIVGLLSNDAPISTKRFILRRNPNDTSFYIKLIREGTDDLYLKQKREKKNKPYSYITIPFHNNDEVKTSVNLMRKAVHYYMNYKRTNKLKWKDKFISLNLNDRWKEAAINTSINLEKQGYKNSNPEKYRKFWFYLKADFTDLLADSHFTVEFPNEEIRGRPKSFMDSFMHDYKTIMGKNYVVRFTPYSTSVVEEMFRNLKPELISIYKGEESVDYSIIFYYKQEFLNSF